MSRQSRASIHETAVNHIKVMPGYILFIFMGFGIGALIPGPGRLGFRSPGLRLYLGIGFAPVAAFLLHRIAGISLYASVLILVAAAAAGLALMAWRLVRNPPPLADYFNPAILLPIAIGVIALIFGKLNYLPYSGDEFSGWLNVAKQINALGRYAPEDMGFMQADYTPGWPLLMSFPGILSGQFEERMLALTPIAMHVGLLGLAFDLCNRALLHFGDLPVSRRMIFSWLVILLLLGAEASGQLVARNLLVEPPQVYGMSIIMVLVASMFLPSTDRRWALFIIGLAFAILYFIKVSALSLLPPLIFLALVLPAAEKISTGTATSMRSPAAWLGQSLANLALIIIPGAVLILLWKSSLSLSTTTGSPSSVLLPEMFGRAFSAQSIDISRTFAAAVWNYTSGYKSPVSAVALLGLIIAAFNPRWRLTVAVLVIFLVAYFGALYWYHIAVWVTELKSIQRFSRVPIRVFHLVGLLILALQAAEFILRRHGAKWNSLAEGRFVFGTVIGLTIVLAGWQLRQADRRITDLSARQYQHVSYYHTTIPKAAARVVKLLKRLERRKPKILVIEQAGNPDVLEVVNYHLISNNMGSGLPDVRYHSRVSWKPTSGQRPNDETKPSRLIEELSSADIIWPVRLDNWMSGLLSRHLPSSGCTTPLSANIFLVERRQPLSLACVPKRLAE